jgi:hypothetical protein
LILVRVASLAAVAFAVLACATLAATEQPALIERPTPESNAELARVLGEAFNGRSVTIADDALTRDSALVIEHRAIKGLEGNPAGGRSLETPEVFRLVLRDRRCELIRSSDQRRWALSETSCVVNRSATN